MRRDLVIAYGAVLAVNFLPLFVTVPLTLQMIIATTATIYIGCQNGVMMEEHVDGANKKKSNQERMQRKDVYMFPVIGSAVLLSLYIAYKLIPTFMLTILVKFYFLLIGVFCLGQRIAQIASLLLPKETLTPLETAAGTINFFPLVSKIYEALPPVAATFIFTAPETEENKGKEKPKLAEEDYKLPLTRLQFYSLAAAGLVGVWYILTGHWLSSNLFGVTFSIQGIELIHLGSILNGVILLSGLFFYDVFWVFGTDVMVTVAKNFDAPIKLLFPRAETRPAMLGLGDIVIPGIFIAMMLRLDIAQANARAEKAKSGKNAKSSPASKSSNNRNGDFMAQVMEYFNQAPYFNTCMIGYVIGLVTTLFVMFVFQAAQPALLYLVPTCVGSVAIRALKMGEWQEFIKYEEAEEVEEAEPASPSKSK